MEVLTRSVSSPRHLPRGVAWPLLSRLSLGLQEYSLSTQMGPLPQMRGMPGEGESPCVVLVVCKHMNTGQ